MAFPRSRPLSLALFSAWLARAQQPSKSGTANSFEVVGDSGVSAQQMFLGTANRVYIIDKTENNPLQVNGHPAWASEYNLDTNAVRALDVLTNSFCAGGGVLGNGTWLNVGGNQATTYGGNTADSQTGASPYGSVDGGKSLRIMNPCDDSSCGWIDDPALYLTTRRWYPTLETLPDGSLIIIGGNQWGGFVNAAGQNNPTYEFFPSRGQPVGLNILTTTLPANLFPLTWVLPSGNLFIQTNWGAEIFDYKNNVEYAFPNIPHAVRTYPASGGTVMLPLTPANNYKATILFCGGSNLEPDQWVEDWAIAKYPADASCVTITPDESTTWNDDDPLPEGRTLGSMILLPDQKVLLLNGANTGVAGYGNVSWAVGHSYADSPIKTPVIYDPNASKGSKWSRDGLQDSTVVRMYHSGALLLPDGSVFVSGSNPNPDYIVQGVTYPTEYRVERFYPWYYQKRRPEPKGLPTTLSYGGKYWQATLTKADLNDDPANTIKNTKAVVIRTGFSTHAINMSQRLIELGLSYTVNDDGSATLYVSQMPPNAAILPPGPAMLFITVDGVPSVGQWVMVGSGKIETQATTDAEALPSSSISDKVQNNGNSSSNNNNNGKSAAWSMVYAGPSIHVIGVLAALVVLFA